MEISDLLVILMLSTFIGLLMTGFPITFVLGGLSVIFAMVGYFSDMYLDTMTGLDFSVLGMIVMRVFKLMSNWVLVAIPMFIYMGLMLDRSGIAEKMMDAMQKLFGKVRGGLAVSVAVIGIILAAIGLVLLGQAELAGGTDETAIDLLAIRLTWEQALYEQYGEALEASCPRRGLANGLAPRCALRWTAH